MSKISHCSAVSYYTVIYIEIQNDFTSILRPFDIRRIQTGSRKTFSKHNIIIYIHISVVNIMSRSTLHTLVTKYKNHCRTRVQCAPFVCHSRLITFSATPATPIADQNYIKYVNSIRRNNSD